MGVCLVGYFSTYFIHSFIHLFERDLPLNLELTENR